MSPLQRWAIRAGGSAIILGAILWLLPTQEVLAGFRALDWRLFGAVLAAFLAGHAAAAGKWWVLTERPVAFRAALRAHFAGLAANLGLPGVAGGDAVRAGLVLAAGGKMGPVVAGSLTDRLIDMLALALLSAVGAVLLAGGAGGVAVLAGQAVGLVMAMLVGAFLVLPALAPSLVRRFPRLPAQGVLLKIAAAFGALAARPGRLALALALSAGIQALFVVLTLSLAANIGVTAPVAAWFFAWPLAKILAVLPISLGGIGVREASLAALMTPFGAAAAGVVAASLIWQAVLFAAGLIGAVAWGMTGAAPAGARPTVADGPK